MLFRIFGSWDLLYSTSQVWPTLKARTGSVHKQGVPIQILIQTMERKQKCMDSTRVKEILHITDRKTKKNYIQDCI